MTESSDPQYGMQTLEVVKQLRRDGVQKISILMRHSARHYDEENKEREPLLWLTEEGKDYAYRFGKNIPETPVVRFYSSMLGRCIETAYQADKAYTASGGQTISNIITIELAPSFVKTPFEVFRMHAELGTPAFFSKWFAGEISDEIVGPSDQAALAMVGRLGRLLLDGPESHIDIGVSHDWCLYMVKHHLLKLDLEKTIQVAYLEGIVLFEKNGALYITSHEIDPFKLDIPLPVN